MGEKDGFLNKVERFLNGKGFYIVLSACAVIVGVSAWMLISAASDTGAMEKSNSVVRPSVPASVTEPETPVTERDEETAEAEQDEAEEAEYSEPEETDEVIMISEDEPVFTWPVSGKIETPYSVETLLYSKTMADWRTHNGVDIAAERGTTVVSAGSGTVESVYHDDLLGTTVIVDHGGGLKSMYSNLAEEPAVSAGDEVDGSAVIGSVGDTAIGETVEVPHLHFSMTLNGETVDPEDYLPRKA